jgi:hypothetical protein
VGEQRLIARRRSRARRLEPRVRARGEARDLSHGELELRADSLAVQARSGPGSRLRRPSPPQESSRGRGPGRPGTEFAERGNCRVEARQPPRSSRTVRRDMSPRTPASRPSPRFIRGPSAPCDVLRACFVRGSSCVRHPLRAFIEAPRARDDLRARFIPSSGARARRATSVAPAQALLALDSMRCVSSSARGLTRCDVGRRDRFPRGELAVRSPSRPGGCPEGHVLQTMA